MAVDQIVEATYQVVTPMFCGGAEQKSEFRLPSFKGVLRFWWRALMWGRLNGDLGKLQEAEDYLFGSASGGERGGQSKVWMRWTSSAPSHEAISVGQGARYPKSPSAGHTAVPFLGGVQRFFRTSDKGEATCVLRTSKPIFLC
ncbi:MAG: type III-B CRISPR module RAMP protein Cmr1 [Myxococcales bacterium]|jgi:hypothetical protein|nr:type III-B CRISPR module RAMP protein Cmr1 [Myxococcales bacterium]